MRKCDILGRFDLTRGGSDRQRALQVQGSESLTGPQCVTECRHSIPRRSLLTVSGVTGGKSFPCAGWGGHDQTTAPAQPVMVPVFKGSPGLIGAVLQRSAKDQRFGPRTGQPSQSGRVPRAWVHAEPAGPRYYQPVHSARRRRQPGCTRQQKAPPPNRRPVSAWLVRGEPRRRSSFAAIWGGLNPSGDLPPVPFTQLGRQAPKGS